MTLLYFYHQAFSKKYLLFIRKVVLFILCYYSDVFCCLFVIST